MIDRKTLMMFAVIAIIAVASLFLFHFTPESLSATHGPIFSMQSTSAASLINTRLMAATFTAIVLVAVVRCRLFAELAKESPTAPTVVSPLDPPIRS